MHIGVFLKKNKQTHRKKRMNKLQRALTAFFLMASMPALHAQQIENFTGQNSNFISTGMPILLIAPDAIAGAMGDVGAASTPDAYSAHWNNAKFAFIENDMGLSTTYTPWLRNLNVSDMNLLYLGGYKRINDRSTVAASLTYFTLGEILSRDGEGNSQGMFNPNEFAFDLTYSMKVSDQLSIGATGRYIRSDLTNGMTINDGSGYTSTNAANSLAADVGVYYQTQIDIKQDFAAGAFISNMGAKLSYSDDDTDKEFLPANLRIGGRYTNNIDDYNKLNVMLDFNKLLVPTPPIADGENIISDYYSNMTEYNNTSTMSGLLQSFYDAPGGFREEIQEVQMSLGAEYWYNNTFAFRGGYFYEHANKGGRQYMTLGFGLRYNIFLFDLSYLIPTTAFGNNPLSNTLRISISLNIS